VLCASCMLCASGVCCVYVHVRDLKTKKKIEEKNEK